MGIDEIISKHVAGTTIDPDLVRKFIRENSNYYGWGVQRKIDETSLVHLNFTDLFEFKFRHYLLGHPETLESVFDEVRDFVKDDANAAHYLIKFSIKLVKQRLLENEWYELIPRLEDAQQKILRVAPEIDYLLRPLLVSFLEDSYQPNPSA